MSETTDESEIRRIAREEARKVSGLKVEDPDGEEWSLDQLMERFQVDRRTALKTIGLIAVGYHAPRAVLSAISKPAAAAADDNLTVPGRLDAGAITTEQLVIGGTLYEEDDNSPFTASNTSSAQYTVAGTYNDVILIPDRDQSAQPNQYQVNGDSGQNYTSTARDGTESTGNTEWGNARLGGVSYIEFYEHFRDRLEIAVVSGAHGGDILVAGENQNVSGPINTITLKDNSGSSRSVQARVFGRVMDI